MYILFAALPYSDVSPFSAILFSALTTMAEIPALFSQRPIILRHFKAAMYHPFVESMALTLVDVPITLFTLAKTCQNQTARPQSRSNGA